MSAARAAPDAPAPPPGGFLALDLRRCRDVDAAVARATAHLAAVRRAATARGFGPGDALFVAVVTGEDRGVSPSDLRRAAPVRARAPVNDGG